jgi:hypothetical protein
VGGFTSGCPLQLVRQSGLSVTGRNFSTLSCVLDNDIETVDGGLLAADQLTENTFIA